jgi:hypothetical protein
MTLAQAQLFVAIVVALIATWGGLLMATALLFPVHTKRAEYALETQPGRSFLKGLGVLAVLILGFGLLSAGGPLQLAGFVLTLFAFGLMVLGGASIAHLMGRRIGEMTDSRPSFFSLVSGSLIYSLAVGFPYIGWLLFAPVSLVFAMGAGWSAIRPMRQVVAPPAAPTPSYDLK